MPFWCGESLMEINPWDFHFDPDSDPMTCVDGNSSACGSESSEQGVNSDQILHNGLFNTEISDSQSSGGISGQEALQGLSLQGLLGQHHMGAPMHFSSNHLLVAAKVLQQKRLLRASAHMLFTGLSYPEDTLSILSQGTHDGTKFSLPRSWEGLAGMTNESPSVGSKTASPQQVPRDSSSPAICSSPYLSGCPYAGEQAEHHSFLFQERCNFPEAVPDSFNYGSVHVKQGQNAMLPTHPQLPCGLLIPSFPEHNGGNQPHNPCEVGMVKTKPRVRARRGQATDPHSIAERLRRVRIADRIKALQELVPNTNKVDRAIMLDEIIEYVKFLLIQVKLLSMTRLGGAALISPIALGLPEENGPQTPSEIQGDGIGTGSASLSAMEEHFARLISTNVGAAVQFIQKKGLCLAPLSLIDASKPRTDVVGSQTCSLNLLN